MPAKLSVNLNKIALLRNQRPGRRPDPLRAGETVLRAGADGLTVHPRPDERHIRASDVHALAELLSEKAYAGAEFNMEGNPFGPAYMRLCRAVRPDQATLVPDAPDAATSDAGWNLADISTCRRLHPLIGELQDLGCRVSLFMNADAGGMEQAAALGADRVELYTGPYAEWFAADASQRRGTAGALHDYAAAARKATQCGLGVNAGHDLDLDNLPGFQAALPGLLEVSIGHAFTADALWLGLGETVRRYLAALGRDAAA